MYLVTLVITFDLPDRVEEKGWVPGVWVVQNVKQVKQVKQVNQAKRPIEHQFYFFRSRLGVSRHRLLRGMGRRRMLWF